MSSSQAFADRVASMPCPSCLASVNVAHVEPLSTIPCPSCGKEMTVPGIVGSLVLKRLIGRGTSGIVYQAFDQHLNKDVAVKVFLRQPGRGDAGGQDIIEKCLAEAEAMSAITHPNIVEIHRVAQKGERPFIVMELLTGDRLDHVIASHLLVEEHRALRMAIDVASGLKAVHDAGFAHLDVKPANIQMTGDGVCKLLDYDTARSQRDIEQDGAGLVGTPYYVAPEIIRQGPVDFRADIYSLGATLFHLIAQRPPFQGSTPREVVQERLRRKAVNLREIRSDVSEATAAVINKMLEAEPAERYANYDLLLADLRKAQQIAVDRAMQRPLAMPANASVTASRTPILVGAGLAVVILLGIIGWMAVGSDGDSAQEKDAAKTGTQGGLSYRPGHETDVAGDKDAVRPPIDPVKDAGASKDVMKTKDGLPEVNIRPIEKIKPIDPVSPDPVNPDPVKPADPPKDESKSMPDPPVAAPKLVRNEREFDGWKANDAVTLRHKPGALEVWATAGDPSLTITGLKGAGAAADGAVLEIRLKATGEGAGRLSWAVGPEAKFDAVNSKPIALTHDGEFHDHLIAIPAKGEVIHLRLDLGTGVGIFEIASIAWFADAKAIRPTQQWKFE